MKFNPGDDCRDAFKAAYENRYTWSDDFPGYSGECNFENHARRLNGQFNVGSDLKASVVGIEDQDINKLVTSQLWEVAIHRVRRRFDDVHGENVFIAGNEDDIGMEVYVKGKSEGDSYSIKNNIVTMVNRHIHGQLIEILTKSVTQTGHGYLSTEYTSQYYDPISRRPSGLKSNFNDTFIKLESSNFWVLSERTIKAENHESKIVTSDKFSFFNLRLNS